LLSANRPRSLLAAGATLRVPCASSAIPKHLYRLYAELSFTV
jgi:hypothetical protein